MSKSDPGTVALMSNRQRILNLALQGLTIEGIMEATGLGDNTVRDTLIDIKADLSLRLQEAQESWIALNLARMEKIVSKVMPIFDVPAPNLLDQTAEGEARIKGYVGLIGEAAKVYTNVAKLQKEILQLKIDAPAGNNPSLVQHNTFIANSDFYQVALENLHLEGAVRSFDDEIEAAQPYIDVIPTLENDRLSKIESKLDKILPPPDAE